MLFVIVPLSVLLLGCIVYFALSPGSSRTLRLAAVGALGASILAVLICVIILVAGMDRSAAEPVMPDFFNAEPPPAAEGNGAALLVVAAVLLAFLGTVVVLSLRERRRQESRRGPGARSVLPPEQRGYSS
jgi:ABC-type phosphate transport system permease subunit